LNASDPLEHAASDIPAARGASRPRPWTLHALNSGVIFSATCRGVAMLPRRVSYAIGVVGTWLAWRFMSHTRSALADNLRAVFPDAPEADLRRHALSTFRAYARDVIDFLHALRAPEADLPRVFEFRRDDQQLLDDLLARGRGIVLVSGHYGNWEAGAVFLRRVCRMPLTIVAMTEASPEVNRLRREIRGRLGADTIEVRQSLDTALQIRRRLADNGIVAMLMDRHLGRDRIEVTFLGRRASFLKTPPLMGFLTGAPLLPCFVERTRPGRFTVSAGEPILVSTDLGREDAVQRAAQQFADQLSARVRMHPEYWYHFYRYWESSPGNVVRPA
jgi:KDO2-lipid IV(A) lauroyltransferase